MLLSFFVRFSQEFDVKYKRVGSYSTYTSRRSCLGELDGRRRDGATLVSGPFKLLLEMSIPDDSGRRWSAGGSPPATQMPVYSILRGSGQANGRVLLSCSSMSQPGGDATAACHSRFRL